jgi:UDP-2,3-diacylglucosamine hydrolase
MRLYLSDLHLEDVRSPQFQTLASVLVRESRRCEGIYFLGDLLEVWVGDDDDDELACALIELLSETAQRCNLFVMHGNRDFLLGDTFAGATGVRLLKDPYLTSDGTLLSHGDAFCIEDIDYQATRIVLRSEAWQRQILEQPLDARRQLAASMRASSREANENKAANIMDVCASEVSRVMMEQQATRLIHGHTHRPGVHQESWGRRYVLGAWERCGWLLREQNGSFQLECLPLVDRCET